MLNHKFLLRGNLNSRPNEGVKSRDSVAGRGYQTSSSLTIFDKDSMGRFDSAASWCHRTLSEGGVKANLTGNEILGRDGKRLPAGTLRHGNPLLKSHWVNRRKFHLRAGQPEKGEKLEPRQSGSTQGYVCDTTAS